MNLRKTIARGVALALLAAPLSLAVAGTEGAAQAATSPATTTTLDPIDQTTNYGDQLLITGSVTDASGVGVYDGTVTLMASAYPYTSWTPVATDSAGGYVSFWVKPGISTRYQLNYGGHKATSQYDDTYNASHSASYLAPVARGLKIKHHGLHMKGKVKPAAKLKLVFKIRKHKKYKKWFKVKTNKKGKWSKQIHGKVGTRFVVVVPASKGYAATSDAYRII